ncbi:GTP-binding protein [Salibacterium salarium]
MLSGYLGAGKTTVLNHDEMAEWRKALLEEDQAKMPGLL